MKLKKIIKLKNIFHSLQTIRVVDTKLLYFDLQTWDRFYDFPYVHYLLYFNLLQKF